MLIQSAFDDAKVEMAPKIMAAQTKNTFCFMFIGLNELALQRSIVFTSSPYFSCNIFICYGADYQIFMKNQSNRRKK